MRRFFCWLRFGHRYIAAGARSFMQDPWGHFRTMEWQVCERCGYDRMATIEKFAKKKEEV